MNRILEFTPSQEEAVVSRVLMQVHQAIDQYLPSASEANRQFTKTLYSDDGERTNTIGHALTDDGRELERETKLAFGSNEVTSPGRDFAEEPPYEAPKGLESLADAKDPPAPPAESSTLPSSIDTPLSLTDKGLDVIEGPDWATRVIVAVLIAGLLVLSYVLFA